MMMMMVVGGGWWLANVSIGIPLVSQTCTTPSLISRRQGYDFIRRPRSHCSWPGGHGGALSYPGSVVVVVVVVVVVRVIDAVIVVIVVVVVVVAIVVVVVVSSSKK